jgi:hypothetical protein
MNVASTSFIIMRLFIYLYIYFLFSGVRGSLKVFLSFTSPTLWNMGDEGILQQSVSDSLQYISNYSNKNGEIGARCGCHLFATCMKQAEKVVVLCLNY